MYRSILGVVDRRSRSILIACGLSVLLLAVVSLALGGSVAIPFGTVLREIARGDLGGGVEPSNLIIWQLRIPRLLAAILVGAVLGGVGSAFQAVFRNPLAEPYVIGVSSGAGLAGALAVVAGLGGWMGGLALSLAGAVGGLLTLGLVFALAKSRQGTATLRLLLGGVIVGTALAAGTSLVLLLAGEDSNQVLRWLLGSLTPMHWPRLAAMLMGAIIAGVILMKSTRALNALAVDESLATRLGFNPRKILPMVLGGGSLVVGLCVGSVGIIGFVGLIAPHLARSFVGADQRVALPLSAVLGSFLLILADLLAQKIVPGTELPVGSITALLGAPALWWILRRPIHRLA